jgi:plastocyanin
MKTKYLAAVTQHKSKVIWSVVLIVILALGYYFFSNISSLIRKTQFTDEQVRQEDSKQIVRDVISKAQISTSVDISSCDAKPAITQIKMGLPIDFLNKDTSAHVISFSPARTYEIPANSKFRIVFDFYKFPGVRKYTCDSKQAGSVLITQQ